MAEAHRDLAPVLEANKTAGLGARGLADLVGYRLADVTVSGRARHVPGNVSAANRRVLWGGVAGKPPVPGAC